MAEKQPSEPPKPKKHKSTGSDEDDEKCAQSRDSERTLFYTDLYVLTNDEHWTMTPETENYVAAAGSFCFMTTENGEQQEYAI